MIGMTRRRAQRSFVLVIAFACFCAVAGCSGSRQADNGSAGSSASLESAPLESAAPLASSGSLASSASVGVASSPARTCSSGAEAASATVPAAALGSLQLAVQRLVGAPAPAPLTAALVGCRVHAWSSVDDFTVLVTVSLHFASADTGAWNEGANDRFVRFTRVPGDTAYRLTWASSP